MIASDSEVIFEEEMTSSSKKIVITDTNDSKRKLPLGIWIFSIFIFVLTIVLLVITIILIITFTCVSIHLKPRCHEGFCIEASRYSKADIETNIVHLVEAKIEALVVKLTDYSGSEDEKVVNLVNSYGVGFLFEIDFSAGVEPFKYPNNGYIIVGTDLDAIKAYDWVAITRNYKILQELSCSEVCVFVKMVSTTDHEAAKTESFVGEKGLCGLYYESSLHPDLVTNPALESTLESTSIISFALPVAVSTTYRPYGHVKSSLSLSYTTIADLITNKPFLVEVWSMRRKLFMSFSNADFVAITLTNTQVVYLKQYTNTVLGTTYDVVLLTTSVTESVTIQDIVSTRKGWSFLLGPSEHHGDLFDKFNTAPIIQRTDTSEFVVVALY